jgi:MFS family permease
MTLVVASAATLLVLVDFTTVLAMAPQTAVALGASVAWQTWSLGAMSLGLAAALLTAGALADRAGRRRALVVSAVGLAVATALAAAAPTIAVFVAARLGQGVAGAGVLAAALGMIGHAFPSGSARTRATGIWGAMVGAGIALGPLLAASLALVGDWRTAYWSEALLAAALAFAARAARESRTLGERAVDAARESRTLGERAVDAGGALAFAAAMAALVAGLVQGRHSWTAPITLVLLAAGVALVALFARIERRSPTPMLDLTLLRHPTFVASLVGALATGLTTIALMSYLPTFLQRALSLPPLPSAGVLAAWSAPSALVAWHARRLPGALSARHRLTAGFLICAAGLAALAQLPADAGWLRLLPGLVVTGTGTGLVNAALGQLAVASVPPDRPGLGSGANNTARYLGGAAGVALVVALAVRAPDAQPTALVHGWNIAALTTATLSLAGALAVAACRERRPPTSPARRARPGPPGGARTARA